MQRPPHIDLLPALRTALDHLQITSNRPPLLVIHSPRLLVADPGVGTTSTRVHPHDVAEAKVLAEGEVDNLDGHGHELPAFVADVGLVAAGTDVIVVCQIDIEAQLLGEGLEGSVAAQGLAVARVGCVDGADFETGGHEAEDVLAEAACDGLGNTGLTEPVYLERNHVQVCCRKGLVSQVGIVLQGEGKLSVAKVVCRRGAVVEPLEEVAPGEETLVEEAHDLGIRGGELRDLTVVFVSCHLGGGDRELTSRIGHGCQRRAGARGRLCGSGR